MYSQSLLCILKQRHSLGVKHFQCSESSSLHPNFWLNAHSAGTEGCWWVCDFFDVMHTRLVSQNTLLCSSPATQGERRSELWTSVSWRRHAFWVIHASERSGDTFRKKKSLSCHLFAILEVNPLLIAASLTCFDKYSDDRLEIITINHAEQLALSL